MTFSHVHGQCQGSYPKEAVETETGCHVHTDREFGYLIVPRPLHSNMGKRAADKQINHLGIDEDDDNDTPVPLVAAPEVLAGRKIIAPRRMGIKLAASSSPATTPSINLPQDAQSKTIALNEQFLAAVTRAVVPGSVANLSQIAQKYISYYQSIHSTDTKTPDATKGLTSNKMWGSVTAPKSTVPSATSKPFSAFGGVSHKPLATSQAILMLTQITDIKPAKSSPLASSTPAVVDAIEVDSSSEDEGVKIQGPQFTIKAPPILKNAPFTFGPKPARKSDSDSDSEVEIKGPIFQLDKPIKDNVFKLDNSAAQGSASFLKAAQNPNKPSESNGNSDAAAAKPATVGLLFGSKASDKTSEPKPFAFGAAQPAESVQFPSSKTEETTAGSTSKPFAFGSSKSAASSNISAPQFTFSASLTNLAVSKPFAFGGAKSSNTQAPHTSQENPLKNSGMLKPFSFGSLKPVEPAKNFSFGGLSSSFNNTAFSNPTATRELVGLDNNAKLTTEAPKFSFMAPLNAEDEKKAQEKPLDTVNQPFLFGKSIGPVSSGTPDSTSDKSNLTKPLFAFGLTASLNAASEIDGKETPFKLITSGTQSQLAFKPLFSTSDNNPFSTSSFKDKTALNPFGAVANGDSSNTTPLFSFSKAGNSNDEPKPLFSSFGNGLSLFKSGSSATPFGQGQPSISSFGQGPPPSFSFGGPAKTENAVAKPGTDEGEERVEDAESTAQFEPVAQLSGNKIENVVTGEESEEALFTVRAKLMLFDPKATDLPYTNKGLGEVKVLKSTETGKSRILMRADGGLRILLNTPISKDMSYSLVGTKMVRAPAVDPNDKKIQMFVFQVKVPETAQQLLDALERGKM